MTQILIVYGRERRSRAFKRGESWEAIGQDAALSTGTISANLSHNAFTVWPLLLDLRFSSSQYRMLHDNMLPEMNCNNSRKAALGKNK